jgi:sterol desaturase/sphingolipid hydroxylase (fatty acid hydroxylase superfamily)
MNFILLAIPGFFILIAIELLWDHFKGTDYYRLNDSINSLSIGILSRITGALYGLLPLSLYAYTYESFALFTWEDSVTTWIIAFVIYDLCYYWNHRFGHTINIGWASHVIHHSSEEYNLTTALRQTSIPNPIGAMCFIPMLFLGFPPWLLVGVGSLNLIYQYWVHTQVINRMPEWYEAIFITPSNHRVHHAKNKVYIDKNYGGVFLIWDRIFNTFQPELKQEKVIFGISTQLASWNPIWGNLQVLTNLLKDASRTDNWFDKFTLWFRKTGYRPEDVAKKYPILKSNLAHNKFDTPLNKSQQWYVFIQYIFVAAGILPFMILLKDMTSTEIIVSSVALTFCLFSMGRVQENSTNSMLFEAIKFVACTLVCIWMFSHIPAIGIIVALISTGSLIALAAISRNLTSPLTTDSYYQK